MRVSGLGLTIMLSASNLALAQVTTTSAEQLFREGVTLLGSGRFADARAQLQQALAERESPAVVYNLALAERGLGHYVEASALLDRWFQLVGDRADAPRRAEVDALRQEVRAGVGFVTVRVAAVEAEVTVDGARWGLGQLGISVPINPGHHVFRASGDALRAAEQEIDLTLGERATLTLVPRPLFVTGTLRVEPSSAEAVVYVDRHRVGVGVFEAEVRPGPHQVAVRASGFPTFRAAVEVHAGRVEDLRVTLTRETSVFRRWWFWAGTGMAVAGVVAAVLFATLSGPEAPGGGTLGWVVQAQFVP